jgi:hypothetical protein
MIVSPLDQGHLRRVATRQADPRERSSTEASRVRWANGQSFYREAGDPEQGFVPSSPATLL